MSVRIEISGGQRPQASDLAIKLAHWLRSRGYPISLAAKDWHRTQALRSGLESIHYASAPFDPHTRVEVLVD